MDCIVLVGNRENYREVSNENNKAFLKIGSRTILEIMLAELAHVESIDRLLLVGPKARLETLLNAEFSANYPKPLLIFEQKRDLLENVMAVLNATAASSSPDRYVLVLPSDIPLVTTRELRQFIHHCDMDRYDYVIGLTTGEALARFYPTAEKPGVQMSYFYLSSGKFRVNNMHMVRPAALKHMGYIRKTYGMRYQKEFSNMLKMGCQLAKVFFRAPMALFFYVGMQTTTNLRAKGWDKLSSMIEKYFKKETAEKHLSAILGTRFQLVVTHFGGSAIDVDNEDDYHAIETRFQEWIAMQKGLS